MYLILVGIVLAAAVLPTDVPKEAPKPSVVPAIERAAQAIEASRFAEGEKLLNEACSATLRPDVEKMKCLRVEALLMSGRAKYADAERLQKGALEAWGRQPSGNGRVHVRMEIELGDIYRHWRHWDEAKRTFETALTEEKDRPADKEPSLEPVILSRIASTVSQVGDYSTAKRLLMASIEQLKKDSSRNGELAFALSNLGLTYAAAGDYRGAEEQLRASVDLAEKVVGQTSPELTPYLNNLAFSLLMEGKLDGAELVLIRARSLWEKSPAGDRQALIQTLAELAGVLGAEAKYGAAEECGTQALREIEKVSGPQSLDAAMMRVSLATVYLRANRVAEAEQLLPEAVAVQRRLQENRRVLNEGIYRLAELRTKQKRWREADALFRESIENYKQMLGPQHPDLLAAMKAYEPVRKQMRSKTGIQSFR